MAEKIRGLTVDITANAANFKKGMNACRKSAKETQSELNALQKSLELKFDSATFARAQKVAQEAIDKTAANVDTLRQRLAYLEKEGNVNTAEYERLRKELAQAELSAQQLQKQLEKINQIKFNAIGDSVQKVGGQIQSAGQALAPFSALAAATAAGTVTLGVKAAAAGAEIDDLALRLGVSAEKIQEWQYVTAQAGVDWEVFNKALIKGRAALLDLSSGTVNNATKAIQGLGLSLDDFGSQEEMFDGLIDALAGMENKTLQAAYANEIFGDKIANQMLPYLNAGTDAINQFKSEFAQMSPLTNEQVAALAVLDDKIYLLKESLKKVTQQLGAAVMPLVQSIVDALQNKLIPKLQSLAEWFSQLTVGQQKFAMAAMVVVAAIAPLTIGVGKLVSAVGSIIKAIPQLSAALSGLAAHPIILIIAAIAMVLVILYTQCEAFRESINNLVGVLGSALQPVLDVVMSLLNQIMGLLTPILDIIGGILGQIINMVVTALQPFFDMLSMIFGLLQPFIDIALIPMRICLQALQVPLQVLGTLLGWLAPLFQVFGNIVNKIFGGVIKVINLVLGVIEDAVNFVIGIINGLIDGVNGALGWLGVHIDRIAEVKLRIDTSDIDDIDDVNAIIDDTPPATSGGGAYDQIGAGSTGGDIYNNDYSTNNTTQHVQVVIQNYAAEVDVDEMVRQINVKLAEAM